MRFLRAGLMSFSMAAVVLAATASMAFAAPPFSLPKEITRITFESDSPDSFTELSPIIIYGDQAPPAYWGKTGAIKHAGSYSLWCAGTLNPSMAANPYGNYPKTTRGHATKKLTQLADYYSSQVGFYYLMPSLEVYDYDSFKVMWQPLDQYGNPGTAKDLKDFNVKSSSWAFQKAEFALPTNDVNLSRSAGQVTFRFFGHDDYRPAVGAKGPAIDDIVFSGFKYGPVRSLAAVATNHDIQLSWSAPAQSNKTSADETRPITYRVWRTLAGYDDWHELTPSSGIAEKSFVDASVSGGFTYQYVVQAWDALRAYGVQGTPKQLTVLGEKPQADSVSTPSAPSPVMVGQSFTVGGVILPVHRAGYPVATIQASKNKSTISASFTATSGSSGAYSASVKLPSNGVWYLRTKHEDADHRATYSGWKAVTVRATTAMSTTYPTAYSSTSDYAKAKTSGYLKSGSTALAYRLVTLQQSFDGKTWKDYTTIKTSSSGYFTYSAPASYKRYYRWLYKGESTYTGSTSPVRLIYPKVYFSSAPKTSYSTMTYGKYYSVWGYFKPKHAVGSKEIKVRAYKRGAKKADGTYEWPYYKTYVAKVVSHTSTSSYSKYKYSYVKLPRGTWRLRAVHEADSKNATTYSSTLHGWKYVTVK